MLRYSACGCQCIQVQLQLMLPLSVSSFHVIVLLVSGSLKWS
jgi:hypothetical protein